MAVKKGIFFTIDSLLASGIVILAILLVSTFYINEHKKVNVGYASQDLVRVFSTLKIGEVDNEYVKSLIESGEITNKDNTIIEQIGDFWAQDKVDTAKRLTTNLTYQLIPANYGFSIFVDGEEIYSNSVPLKKALVSSRKLVSGIAKAQPTEGFTARILLQGIKSKKTSSYAYFGGYEGDGNLTKILTLPNDVIYFNSSYLEVDAGTNFDLYINGAYSGTYTKGSGGGGIMLADKWNISNAYLANFVPGANTININFTGNGSKYIAGGFLRVTYITSSYNDTQTQGFEKYLFPGIDGAINLYSSIYVPNLPFYMNISLHFNSPYTIFLTLGNLTVFELNSSSTEQLIIINNSNLSSSLDYSQISQKILPLRLGLKSTNITGVGTISDSVLVTDRTGSMDTCDVLVNCTAGLCDSNPTGGCHDRRDNVAIKANKKFIDTVANVTGNFIGLVGFGESLQPYCDFHDFSGNSTLLKYRVSNYSNAFCGFTCISCGVLTATELLVEKQKLYGLNQSIFINTTQNSVGDPPNPTSVTKKLPVTVNKSKLAKARLEILGENIEVDSGYEDCIYFNNRYIGRMCDSASGWHTCSFPLKPEWFSDTNNNNVTITGGTTSGCTATSGTNDNWNLKDVSLVTWQTLSLGPNLIYNFTKYNFTVGDSPYSNIVSVNMSLDVSTSKTKAATLEFEAVNISLTSFDCVYVNGNYVGRVDYQRFNNTVNVWQKVIFDVPAVWIKNGINQINITGGTTSGCTRTSGTNDKWTFKNINLSVMYSDEGDIYGRIPSMLIMSDGEANTKIGDCPGCNTTGASNETIQLACEARNLYGISIYTVLFGNVGSAAIRTLNKSACCDDCSHFYTANDSDSLLDAYTKIATSIITVGFVGQTVNVSGNILQKTHLYPDSYISFNYTPLTVSEFNKVPLTFETDRFGNNITNGILTIYPNTSVSDAKVTSYSGNSWTDNLIVNGNTVFRLSDYGSNYLPLGDPFIVNIPVTNINQGNNTITISTGLNSTNSTGGSSDNRAIYTLLLNGFADYSSVVSKSDGCSWNVAFEDGTSSTIKVPSDYSGADVCSFSGKIYDSNDALENVVYELFNNLDIDKDGKIDVNIDENNLNFNTLSISKIPSLWGPAVIEIDVWE